jgi:hypothetical protein
MEGPPSDETLLAGVTTTLAPARPKAAGGRQTFFTLAARERRRFVVNPVFLAGVALTAFAVWNNGHTGVTEIDTVNPYPAIFLGGFAMMATFWQTRSMHNSEPVVGVTPTTLPLRTAALCAVAIVPFLCGVLSLIAFRLYQPVAADRVYGAFSPPARIAVLVAQMVLPTLGGPLLGVALGRWVRFPGSAFVLFLVLYGWVSLVSIVSFTNPDPTPKVVLRLFAPFAFFTYNENGAEVTTWRGSPWWFIGWQLALCAIAVLAALLRAAEGRVRFRVIRTLPIVLALAAILIVLAAGGGFTHAVHA